jgi:hypothetical protein
MRGGRYGRSSHGKGGVVHYLGGGIFIRGPRMRTIASDFPPCHIPAARVTGTSETKEVTCKKCLAFLKNWSKK